MIKGGEDVQDQKPVAVVATLGRSVLFPLTATVTVGMTVSLLIVRYIFLPDMISSGLRDAMAAATPMQNPREPPAMITSAQPVVDVPVVSPVLPVPQVEAVPPPSENPRSDPAPAPTAPSRPFQVSSWKSPAPSASPAPTAPPSNTQTSTTPPPPPSTNKIFPPLPF
jgi:hypothetical protein